jgi:hypothetical protein
MADHTIEPIPEMSTFWANMVTYERCEDFKGDVLPITWKGQTIPYQIEKVQIMFGCRAAPWVEGRLTKDRHLFLNHPITQRVNVLTDGREYAVEGGVEMAIGRGVNPYPKGEDDIWIYLTPSDFAPTAKYIDVDMLIQCIHPVNAVNQRRRMLDAYPQVIEGKVQHECKTKEILKVQAFDCPCAYRQGTKVKCLHNVYLYFTDGTNLMFFGGGLEMTIAELEEKGYLPYIVQYWPDDEDKRQNQIAHCELTRRIGVKKCENFRWR